MPQSILPKKVFCVVASGLVMFIERARAMGNGICDCVIDVAETELRYRRISAGSLQGCFGQ